MNVGMKERLGDDFELLQKEKAELLKLYADFDLAPGLEDDREYGERYKSILDKFNINEKVAIRAAAAGVVQEPDENQASAATNMLAKRRAYLPQTLIAALEQLSKPVASPASARTVGGRKRAREAIADGSM